MSTNKRILWIDNIRSFMVLFIICFHYPGTPSSFRNFVYPFTLAFFFWISGYFFKDNNGDFLSFILKKIKTYIPIIILNALISGLFDVIRGNKSILESIIFILKKIIFQTYGNESLWFIACLIVTQIIMFFVVRKFQKNEVIVLSVCFILFLIGIFWTRFIGIRLFWSIDIALMQMLFVGIGYFCRKNLGIKKYKLKSYLLFVLSVIYIMLYIIFPYADIHRREYTCIWIYPIQALIGIFIISFFFKKFINFYIPVITFLGKNSIYVYAFHGYCIMIYNRIILFIFNKVIQQASIIFTLGVVIFSTILLFIGCKIWLKIKAHIN